MNVNELFEKIESKYRLYVYEEDEDRRTVEIYKNNEACVIVCCVFNVSEEGDTLFRMDYSNLHDRWSNCDYEVRFDSDDSVEEIFNDVEFWINNKHLVDEDFYDRYSKQDYDLNEFMKRTFLSSEHKTV